VHVCVQPRCRQNRARSGNVARPCNNNLKNQAAGQAAIRCASKKSGHLKYQTGGPTMKASSLWQEFKEFALKGSMIDLAIAVVIGKAFGDVVNSLVKNVMMPLIGYIVPGEEGYRSWKIGTVEIGVFLSELINFFVIALVIWIVMVKLLSAVRRVTGPA